MTFLVAGIVLMVSAAQTQLAPFDVKTLRLGTVSTVVIVLESDCDPCFQPVEFYKRLMKMKAMDGKKRKVIVVAMDGVWPVKDRAKAAGFAPHGTTSGPYPDLEWPAVKTAPTILVLDGSGKQRGVWVGPFDVGKQKAITAAATAR
jgi:hypothetical protein